MKKSIVSLAIVVALSQIAAACTVTREQGGAATGAVVGGVVGNQIGGGKHLLSLTMMMIGQQMMKKLRTGYTLEIFIIN